jgi:hypothetical protein
VKLKASLESVKTRKNVTDDIIQTITLNIYGSADQIGELNTLYRKPIEIEITEVKQ